MKPRIADPIIGQRRDSLAKSKGPPPVHQQVQRMQISMNPDRRPGKNRHPARRIQKSAQRPQIGHLIRHQRRSPRQSDHMFALMQCKPAFLGLGKAIGL